MLLFEGSELVILCKTRPKPKSRLGNVLHDLLFDKPLKLLLLLRVTRPTLQRVLKNQTDHAKTSTHASTETKCILFAAVRPILQKKRT